MTWIVKLARTADKQKNKLSKPVRQSLFALIGDIEKGGPVRGDWPNYGKLTGNRHHCHIKKGQPTYVVVWEVQDKTIKLVEVTYVGTHEKAPY
ncbi:cytotoxic translational repressor of toxin-antitoxin stability system [Trichlorobacter lovleyi]|uniref:cytotoxic translational repressor of toxin-antitoxin stability system n=1 Tax=Trichlorobacter lovleyi TaxID=313985 RepID=UPI0023F57B4D|nr:cytotoxic translational repressor of toxin-antitoxin stability system [Trichlorobacter lovleyi]